MNAIYLLVALALVILQTAAQDQQSPLWEDLPLDDPETLQYAEQVLKEIEKSDKCNDCKYEIQEILTAYIQYGSGATLYYQLNVQSRQRTGDVVNLVKERCEALFRVDTSRIIDSISYIECSAYV